MVGESHTTATRLMLDLHVLHCKTSMANIYLKVQPIEFYVRDFFQQIFLIDLKFYSCAVEWAAVLKHFDHQVWVVACRAACRGILTP